MQEQCGALDSIKHCGGIVFEKEVISQSNAHKVVQQGCSFFHSFLAIHQPATIKLAAEKLLTNQNDLWYKCKQNVLKA